MGTIPVFLFAVISCFLCVTVLSQAQPFKLKCWIPNWEWLLKWNKETGARLYCYTLWGERDLVISADFLQQLNVCDEREKKRYLLSEYPHPITKLSFDHRGGITIKENALKALPKLKSLDLESKHGNVTVPSEEFKNTPDLNEFTVGPGIIAASTLQAIRSTPNLEFLKIHSTKGCELKADFLRRLVNLKTVKLIYSGSIENGMFDGLTELTGLTVWGNNISSISTCLPKHSRKLKTISLYDNAISTVPKSAFAMYKQLNELSLAKNPISKIEPGAFEGLENLKHLKLDTAPIHHLPEGILQPMKSLETLSLSETRISKINATTFKGLRNMKLLTISDNQFLETIEPGAFDDFANLAILDMLRNPGLKKLPDGLFKNMEKLWTVDFQGTCVENLSRGNFTHPCNIDRLDLANCTASSE